MADEVLRCGHCGHRFEARGDFAGGLVSCPNCGRVVDVPGLRDPIWLLLRIAGLGTAIAVGVIVGGEQGFLAGAAAGLVALAVLWLVSRMV